MNYSAKKFEFWLNNLLIGLALVIFLIVLIGDRTLPRVVEVNWQSLQSPVGLSFLKIDFSRLMDRKTVEDSFSITPDLEGKFSWSGKSLVFTPNDSFEYGQNYLISISEKALSQDGKAIMPFESFLKMDDLHLAFLRNGKIVFADLYGKELAVFGDDHYQIFKFLLTSDRKYIYFLGSLSDGNIELFRIDTTSKKIHQLTAQKQYLNKNFVLSADGKYLALSRIEVSPMGEYLGRMELWLMDTEKLTLERFKDAQGADAAFSPKGGYLLYRNVEGNFELSKIQLKPGEKEENLFIGEYSGNFGFHPYLPKMAFAQYDQQDVFTLNNNLVLFSGDGTKKQVDMPAGVIRDFIFSQDGKFAILLFSGEEDNLTIGDNLSESRIFHLYRYDFSSGKISQLTGQDEYSELNPDLSKDSRYLLFERVIASSENLVDPAFQNIAWELDDEKQQREIWLMDLKTGDLRNLKFEAEETIFLP